MFPGPRVLASGPPLSITGGHGDTNFLAPQFNWSDDGVADGLDGVQKRKSARTSSTART